MTFRVDNLSIKHYLCCNFESRQSEHRALPEWAMILTVGDPSMNYFYQNVL